MATSAFKSTSRRTSTSSPIKPLQQPSKQQQQQQQKGPPLRRSRSVSAFSRTPSDVSSDFHNKRDNPLFWVDGSPRSDGENWGKLLKFDEISSKLIDPDNLKRLEGNGNGNGNGGGGGGESRRGRTVGRSSGGEGNLPSSGSGPGRGRKDYGRSLSRVDTGRRRRSLSRGRHYGNSESDKDRESTALPNFRSKSKVSFNADRSSTEEKTTLVRSTSDLSEVLKGWNTWSSQHNNAFETSDDSTVGLSGSRIPCWEDGRSTSSISEAEEKTIKPILEDKKISHLREDNDTTGGILETVRTEVRRAFSDMQHDFKNAILRSNSDVASSGIVSDIAPDLSNPNAVELTMDIRGEYAKELEECNERTRKLRAELAVEEHRGLELNAILNNIIPEPKTPQVQKPRAARKASMERRKMLRHLEEEAMAYFDECVSISTFDDSDFSSLEDPPSTSARDSDPSDGNMTVPGVPSRVNVACSSENQGFARKSPLVQCTDHSGLLANSCNNSPCTSSQNSVEMKTRFSFSPKPSGTTSLDQDIRNYVKKIAKDNSGRESSNSQIVSTSHLNKEYTSQFTTEKFLLNKMTFRSRIESGSMVLCGGSFGFPSMSFSQF